MPSPPARPSRETEAALAASTARRLSEQRIGTISVAELLSASQQHYFGCQDFFRTELDRRAGTRQRSAYIEAALRQALEDDRRWEDVESALGSLPDSGHAWGRRPRPTWVRAQREADGRRAGVVARLLLDSTVLIDALRGRPAADRVAGLRRPGNSTMGVRHLGRGDLAKPTASSLRPQLESRLPTPQRLSAA
jgi:hypothetical protein